MIDNLSAIQVAQGHQVTIVTSDGCKNRLNVSTKTPIKRNGVTIYYKKNLSNTLLRKINISTPLGSFFLIKKLIREVDIVHIHEHRTLLSYVASRYARKINKPYIIQPHGSTSQTSGRNRLKKMFDLFFGYRILRDAHKIIAVSEEEASIDRSLGVNPKRISVVYNGIDTNLMRVENHNLRIKYGTKDKVLLYLGRINETKGLDFMLRGFQKLLEKRNDVTFIIAGADNGYLRDILILIDELKIQKDVQYIGEISDGDKALVFSCADVFVHTVRYMGGVGITPLEALLCEVPIVVSPECGELVAKFDLGHVVKMDDIDDFVSTIDDVLNNPKMERDRAIRGRQSILKNYQWDVTSKKIEMIYYDCLNHVSDNI